MQRVMVADEVARGQDNQREVSPPQGLGKEVTPIQGEQECTAHINGRCEHVRIFGMNHERVERSVFLVWCPCHFPRYPHTKITDAVPGSQVIVEVPNDLDQDSLRDDGLKPTDATSFQQESRPTAWRLRASDQNRGIKEQPCRPADLYHAFDRSARSRFCPISRMLSSM